MRPQTFQQHFWVSFHDQLSSRQIPNEPLILGLLQEL